MKNDPVLLGSLYVGASALAAFSKGLQAAAHNVANVSTKNFEPIAARYNERRPVGNGVDAAIILASGGRLDTAPLGSMTKKGWDRPSATDPGREFTNMIIWQRSFQANARTISTVDEMLSYVLSEKA